MFDGGGRAGGVQSMWQLRNFGETLLLVRKKSLTQSDGSLQIEQNPGYNHVYS